jgi:hypothetical protein
MFFVAPHLVYRHFVYGSPVAIRLHRTRRRRYSRMLDQHTECGDTAQLHGGHYRLPVQEKTEVPMRRKLSGTNTDVEGMTKTFLVCRKLILKKWPGGRYIPDRSIPLSATKRVLDTQNSEL